MAAGSGVLYITYVEKQGPFLKIWGQTDRNLPLVIEKSLTQMTPQFESGLFMPTLDAIQCGLLCCAKYKDGAYYRARITNIALLHQSLVEVHFVDYGNKDIIPMINLRTIGNFAPGLITIPSQARDFILANVTHQGSSWDNDTVALISSEIRYLELTWVIVSQIGANTLIKLYKHGEDVAFSFFNRGMVLSIASAAQHMILQNLGGTTTPTLHPLVSPVSPTTIRAPAPPPSAQTVAPVPPPVAQVTAAPPPALLTYKAVSLEPGTDNYVYVSYVSDGPCHFSIQLEKLEETLARLMKELNRMNLQPLEDDPIPGTVCVARCIEDQHICRAVVTSMVDSQYKVFYVDFGNTEVISLDNIYQIPFKYVIPKVMAMRYALAGLERSSVTLEMKCAFKDFVRDKLLRMRTLPPATRSGLPLCSLWDDKGVNVLDVLQQAALLAYPEVMQLTRGFSQEVRVSYVHSCSHFYVQIKAKDDELRKVMADLQNKCPYTHPLSSSDIKVGLPCCALFDADGQWYRAQVLSKEGENVKVRYVDYGNEELVTVNNLRLPPAEQLTALRPQALECCLNGYQNMDDDFERDNILEELILEKEFVMKVVEMQGNRALVDLIDSSRYNVGSLLLERLATARSQVSPLLIQDSHHIEHRKRKSPVQQRLERKPMREQNDKGWNNEDKERTNKQDSWRQIRSPRNDYSDERDSGDNFEKGKGKRDGFKKDNWGGGREDGFKKDNWGGNREDRFKKDSWGENKEDRFKKESWGKDGGNNYRKDSWSGGGESQWKRNGKPPNQREGSEKSFSDGSEKSWRRGPRTNNFNEDRKPRRKFDSSDRGDSWNSTNHDSGFNSSSHFTTVVDPAPSSAVFMYPELSGQSEKVLISWFHDPAHFFCQLQEFQAEFRTMMNEIQAQYCNAKPDCACVGAPVIALYPDDGVMYRAQVLEVKGTQYRVQYIDFGNVSTTDKVWSIENKFMRLAAQAVCCSLYGIIPSGDSWANPDMFSAYFDKEFFMCTFVSSENQNYLVELTYDNQSVSEALVLAGLARYDESQMVKDVDLLENFDPSILLGQQMRVMLAEVHSLDSFSVQLQNGLHLLCTMHNLALATQTYEDTLKQCVGSILIMYVDNVLEEKTEITLYDTLGTKLKILEPDEGAYDTVEILCALPVFYSTINGWISYLTPADGDKFRVFVQPPEYADTLAQLLEDLFNHYDTSEEAALQPEVGLVYAVHSSDGNWYRGQATTVDDQTVTVTFLDYGNSESVSISQLRELTPKFMEQHMMALELLTSGVDETFIEREVTASIWYGENGWEAEIQKVDQSVSQTQLEALLENDSITVAKELSTEQLSAKPREEEIVPEVPDSQTQQLEQVGVSIILSHVDSPNEFYVQLSEDVETINSLQTTLQEQVASFPDLENPAAGVLCAAPYSVDQQWYRAQVLDADVDITTVRFVDYGNTDVLTNSTTHVKTLPPDLLSLEQHARRCSLIIKAADTEWSPAAYERFETLTSVDNLSAEIVHQDEKTTYIELFANGQNVAEVLLQEGLAVKLPLETESSCSGYVSHLNSPSEFWVQLENSVADLEWIAEQLSTAENFPELEDLTPGSLCAALFPEDEMWYRARILSNTVAGLEVLFIDYGNSCMCTGLRQLPEDLIMLPALAQKCSLQKPSGVLQWSSQATEEFKTISADGATIFNIDRLSTGETSIVRLLLGGVDITTKLVAETEDAYISHFESISCFWLQKAKDISKLDTITEKLVGASEWPKYQQKEGCNTVVALYPEDGQWYRAHILSKEESEYDVLFIDFGNTSIATDIRMPMCDIEKESPLATKYKLEPLPGFRWNEGSSKQLAEISANGTTLFQVEFVAGDTVRLYLNGNDIRSDLSGSCISSAQNTPKRSSTVKTTDSIPSRGMENFIDADSQLFVSSDAKIEDELVVEVPQECQTEVNKKDDQAEFETASSVNLQKSSEEVVGIPQEHQTKVNEKDDQAEFETASGVNLQKSSEEVVEIPQGHQTEVNQKDDQAEFETASSVNLQKASEEFVDIPQEHQTAVNQKDDQAEFEIASSVNLLKSSEEVVKISQGHQTEVNQKDDQAEFETASSVNLQKSSEEVVEIPQGHQTEVNKKGDHAEFGTAASVNLQKSSEEVVEIPQEHKTEVSQKDDQAEFETASSVDLQKSSKEVAEIPQEHQTEVNQKDDQAEFETVSSVYLQKSFEEVATSVEIAESLENTKLLLNESKESEGCKVFENACEIPESENRRPTMEEIATLNEKSVVSEVIKETLEVTNEDSTLQHSAGVKNEELQLESLVKLDANKKADIKSTTKEEVCKVEHSKADQCKIMEEEAVAVVESVQRPDEINWQNSEETSIEKQFRSNSPTYYTPQRRSSTPHCEKIVPGAVSRGDLTEVVSDGNEQVASSEEIVPALNEAESKNGHSEQIVTLGSAESRNEKQSKEISSSASFSKISVDERIVPGAISRGDTPEPPQIEDVSDKTVSGAVNGVEVKDKALS